MISDPNLIYYACIAHNTTVLAEFNPTESSLQSLAQECLHQTPPHHLIFTQTTHNRTYTFLIDDPFVYFGIFDETLSRSDQFRFLNRLKDSMIKIIGNKSKWVDGCFSSYCIQGEFHPIFHKLMSKSLDFDSFDGGLSPSKADHCNVEEKGGGRSKKISSVPLLAESKKKKKKKRLFGESEEMLVEDEVDLSDDDGEVIRGEVCTKESGCGGCGGGGRQHKAKKIWRRHVWIVLIIDLAVCLILFGIWLWFCQGFQCVIDG